MQTYQFINLDQQGDVFCVRLKNPRVADGEMEALGEELRRLVDEEQARKVVFSLGPEEPECLISVFLAMLIRLQRRLYDLGGVLALAQVSEHTRGIFRAAGIERFFQFYADPASAVKSLDKVG
jgi:predicted nucleotidyltransferase